MLESRITHEGKANIFSFILASEMFTQPFDRVKMRDFARLHRHFVNDLGIRNFCVVWMDTEEEITLSHRRRAKKMINLVSLSLSIPTLS